MRLLPEGIPTQTLPTATCAGEADMNTMQDLTPGQASSLPGTQIIQTMMAMTMVVMAPMMVQTVWVQMVRILVMEKELEQEVMMQQAATINP